MIYVHPHAVERYQQRVRQCDAAQAKADILSHSAAIEAAARIGCSIVKLGDGSRLIVDNHPVPSVVTVYSRGMLPRQCRSSFA